MASKASEILSQLRDKILRSLSSLPAQPITGIHHYTSADGLIGILESRTLRATRADCVNDPTDGRLYLNHVIERAAAHPALFEQLSSGTTTIMKTTFVASCCRDADELSLWRAYGDNCKGFSIALDHARISGTTSFPTGIVGPTYAAMQYLQPEDLRRHFETRIQDGLAAIGNLPLPPVEAKREVLSHVIALARWESVVFKHIAYKDEVEHRLFVVDERSRDSEPSEDEPTGPICGYRFHPRSNEPIKYLKIPMPEDAIRGITVGPGRDFESTKKQLRSMLKSYRFDPDKIDIKKSDIPWV